METRRVKTEQLTHPVNPKSGPILPDDWLKSAPTPAPSPVEGEWTAITLEDHEGSIRFRDGKYSDAMPLRTAIDLRDHHNSSLRSLSERLESELASALEVIEEKDKALQKVETYFGASSHSFVQVVVKALALKPKTTK